MEFNIYTVESLKENMILVFKNFECKYGIITKAMNNNGDLVCLYDDGMYDELDTIINKREFDLYESKLPFYTFIYLMTEYEKYGRFPNENLKLKKIEKMKIFTKSEIAEMINMEEDSFSIIEDKELKKMFNINF